MADGFTMDDFVSWVGAARIQAAAEELVRENYGLPTADADRIRRLFGTTGEPT